jgi:hypothetical protein
MIYIYKRLKLWWRRLTRPRNWIAKYRAYLLREMWYTKHTRDMRKKYDKNMAGGYPTGNP